MSSEPAHLGISCSTSGSASPATFNNEESQKTATTETTAQRVLSLCTVLSKSLPAHTASTDGGLMQHMGQKHGGQRLLPDSVGQLRCLDRAACVLCGTIRSQRCCGLCNSNTFRTDDRPDIRVQRPASKSRPVPPGEPLDDGPLPNCPIRDTAFTERDKLPLVLRRASAMPLPRMCGLSIRYGLGRKPRRSHEWSPV